MKPKNAAKKAGGGERGSTRGVETHMKLRRLRIYCLVNSEPAVTWTIFLIQKQGI